MRIHFQAEPHSGYVATEDVQGSREGKFMLMEDGAVSYVHPEHPAPLKAASSLAQFKLAARAWDGYCDRAAGAAEEVQLRCVSDLQAALKEIGVLELDRPSYWAVIAEQAQHGLL